MRQTIILLHAEAPPKPAPGQACNGCGVCCATEPCPLGMLLSRRAKGQCAALSWASAQRRYVCGVARDPAGWLRWLPPNWTRRFVLRWIGAAKGCDCTLQTG